MDSLWTTELVRAGYRLIETHISRVFLRGEDVYKTKREVDLGFLDFSTLAARERACHAELELNRRLAPGVYLGVVALVRTADGALAFAPVDPCAPDEVIEWAVHMRRLSDGDRADVLLARGELGPRDLRAIAETLATFHAGARADAETARFGSPEVIARNVEENFEQAAAGLVPYVGLAPVSALRGMQRAFLETQRARLEARVRAGRVRDGHGDLRLEHLYRAPEGEYLAIDCIEFNDRFRFADVCADLAFLTMDLTVHGHADYAELLAAYYAEESGDFGLYDVLDFYESYRALVRAKVSLLLASDVSVAEETRDDATRKLRRYFFVALAGMRPVVPRPKLIVTFGSIASGKSTLAVALRERLRIPVVSTDRTRKQLLGVAPTSPRHDPAFRGAYSAEMTGRVYDEAFARARHALDAGRSVVLDGTFRTQAMRARARELAAAAGAEVVFLECWCTDAVRAARLAARAAGPSISDGRAEIADAFAASFEPAIELAEEERVRLDTGRAREETLAEALRALA